MQVNKCLSLERIKVMIPIRKNDYLTLFNKVLLRYVISFFIYAKVSYQVMTSMTQVINEENHEKQSMS